MKRLIAVLALFVTGAALGAVGDAIYRVTETKSITKAQAACFATCAKNLDAWSGIAGDMRSLCVSRSLNNADSFLLSVTGTKTAPLASIVTTEGVTVEGIVTE